MALDHAQDANSPDRIGMICVDAFDAAYRAGFEAEDESPHAVECEFVETSAPSRPPDTA